MAEIDTAKLRETFCRGEFSFVEENKNIGLLCDEIDRLRSMLRRAGEALAPFADFASLIDESMSVRIRTSEDERVAFTRARAISIEIEEALK